MTPVRILCLAGLLISSLAAFPQVPATPHQKTPAATAPQPIPSVPVAAPALEPNDLTAFFDGIIPMQLERSDIAGASVLVMRDGQVLLKKGYGYADEKTKRAVNPDSTIFRLASISKLFTWIAVMQLEEQGKLNLDTDINQYLDFSIRPAFGKPITLRELMTHRGGFEEETRDIILTDPKKEMSLREFLIQNQPMRIFPPGTIPAYSNYGVGLASYIVQRVSGERFEQYVADHIFTPLGMTHSTFYQPPPKALQSLPSAGYRDDTEKPAVGFELFNPVGAGGISSTAADMGRFGQALLNGGELDGKRILKPETLAQMWTPQFRASPQLPPICMGFYQDWRNDLHWIGHEGDLIAFHSLFFVEPSKKLILFVSYNSAGGGAKPRPEIIDMFSDRYFPSAQKQKFVDLPMPELKQIEGTYLTSRREDSTKLSVMNLFEQRVARVDKDGVLHLEDARDLRGHTIRWKPIGQDLWQEVDGQTRLFAIRDRSGRIVRLAYDFPGVQSQRVRWYENRLFVLNFAGFSLLTLAAVWVAPLSRTVHRVFLGRRPRPVPQPGTIWLTWSPRLAALVWLMLYSVTGIALSAAGDNALPTSGWDKYFVLMNVVTAVGLLLSLFALIAGIRIWRSAVRTITKMKFSLVALACAFLSWFAMHWHLIGPAHRF
jgi:CubicO group peptidase (beta-lactamase class C family)